MQIPVVFNSVEDNRRRCFRAEVDQGVWMHVDGEPVDVLDISAQGVAFRGQREPDDKLCDVQIEFVASKKYRLKPRLKVLFQRNGRCGAEFVGLSDRAQKALSELVVTLQKRAIHRLKEIERTEQVTV